MNLHVIASGSKANCYVMETETEALILECGVPFAQVMKTLQYKNKVKGVLLTHEHGDHAKHAQEYANRSILHGTKGTLEALSISTAKTLKYGTTYRIGGFKVLPFATKHDAVQPCGYVVNHPKCGNVLFATDTYYIPVTVQDLDTAIIECNYIGNTLEDNHSKGIIDKTRYERVITSHMGMDTCVQYLAKYDPCVLGRINVVLIHTSEQNGDKAIMTNALQKALGINKIYAPNNGDVINLNKIPF